MTATVPGTSPVVLIAEELAPSVLEVLGEEVEIRHVDGADRAALLPALADIAATERLLSEQFGVGAWTRLEDIRFGPDETTLRGEPVDFTIHVSLGYAGDLQLELIQRRADRALRRVKARLEAMA